MHLQTLLIDNYDSYTYNLYQLLAEVNGGKSILRLSCIKSSFDSPDFCFYEVCH